MDAYDIQQVSVSDVPGTNAAFQPIVQKRVVFYVGKNGPFFLTYAPADFNAATVLEDMRKQAETLKAIGAI